MTEGMFTTGDGCALHYRWDGPEQGPVLVLSNSLGTSLQMWDAQVAALSGQFRILRYDTRGHGRSDVPPGGYGLDRLGRDVIELVDDLGLERFSFCGLSLGGMTGQWLGWRAPERLERLVIANSSACMGPPSGWDARIEAVRREGMAAMATPVLQRWFTEEFRQRGGIASVMLQGLLDTPTQGYAGCSAAIRDMDMRALLPLIAAPTLIIGGTVDPATPPEHSHQLAAGIAGARLVMLEAAHLSNIEQPDEFTAALGDFLAG
jgi:3-oxoadipate enol-lactonase